MSIASTLVLGMWLLGPPVQRPGETEPLAFDWQAPPSCPSEDEVLERLAARTPASSTHRLDVRAIIDERDSEFVVALTLVNADGASERAFGARDCSTLADAIVLVIAVTLAPVHVAEQLAVVHADVESKPTPEPEPEPTPETAPTVPDRDDSARDTSAGPLFVLEAEPSRLRSRLRVGVRATGGGGYGPTRGGHANVGGALVLLGERWRVEVTGGWSPPRVTRRDDGIGGTFQAWAIAGRGCFGPRARALEFPLCVGIEVGQVRGRGLDSLPRKETASFAWAAANLGQGLWWAPLERLAIGAELVLVIPFTRGRFLVETLEVDRVAAVGVRGLAGIEVRLP